VECAAEGSAAEGTAHYYFMLWDQDGTLERVHHWLYVAARSGRS
jgi:hypothetical protein